VWFNQEYKETLDMTNKIILNLIYTICQHNRQRSSADGNRASSQNSWWHKPSSNTGQKHYLTLFTSFLLRLYCQTLSILLSPTRNIMAPNHIMANCCYMYQLLRHWRTSHIFYAVYVFMFIKTKDYFKCVHPVVLESKQRQINNCQTHNFIKIIG